MSLRPIFKNNPFTMDTWDPFIDMSAPFHHNRIGPLTGEWEETAEAHVLRVDLPVGMKREEVKVEVIEGKTVKISGKKSVEREERHENWHHFERSKGTFLRVMTLPENCRVEEVRSCLENGVLTVTVPKMDHLKKSHGFKNIQVKG